MISVLVERDKLPGEGTLFFEHSSFFKHHTLADLPSTAQIRAAALPGVAHHVSLFPSLDLAVKRVHTAVGTPTSVAEGQCLWVLSRFLPEVRVPEVYGWRREGRELYLFMQMVHGDSLHDTWPKLSESEKKAVCAELGTMVRAFKDRIARPSQDNFIGAIGGQASGDRILFGQVHKAFTNPRGFYEYFTRVRESEREQVHKEWLPYLPPLPYHAPIVFTHGDLHFSNVLVSRDEPRRVMAIIDWEQAGWMPRFWDHVKARYLFMNGGKMEREMEKYLSLITGDVPENEFIAWATYIHSWGGCI